MFKILNLNPFKYFLLENRFERISKKYQELRKKIEEKYLNDLVDNIGKNYIQAAVEDNNLEFPPKVRGKFVTKKEKKKHDDYIEKLKIAEEYRKKEDEELIATIKNKKMQKILQAIEKGDKKFELVPDIEEKNVSV